MIYWAESFCKSGGGGYAVDADPKKALRRARNHVGETAKTELASYVLEFPDDADVDCGSAVWGGWRAKVPATRVVERHGIKITDDELMGTALFKA